MLLTVDSRDYVNTYNSLLSIPDIPRDTSGVYVYGNIIDEIPANVFAHLNVCVTIDLSENIINSIEQDAFNGLLAIEYLHIDQNKLKRIARSMLEVLEALRILTMHTNEIETIEAGSFSGQSRLNELQLQGNDIQQLELSMFTGLVLLKNLSLNRNKIHDIKDRTFAALESLIWLNLAHNSLSHLRSQMFIGLIALRVLHLHGNSLTTVSSQTFAYLYRPLNLRLGSYGIPSADRNPLLCDESLCWLKREEMDGTIIFMSGYKPICSDGGNWDNWSCEHEGK